MEAATYYMQGAVGWHDAFCLTKASGEGRWKIYELVNKLTILLYSYHNPSLNIGSFLIIDTETQETIPELFNFFVNGLLALCLFQSIYNVELFAIPVGTKISKPQPINLMFLKFPKCVKITNLPRKTFCFQWDLVMVLLMLV